MSKTAARDVRSRMRAKEPAGWARRPFSVGLRREAVGFTLIELLVVIAIISLLVSILIPSLKRAKELTRRVVCASNLHQMGLALMTYAADHKGDFPEGGRTGSAPYFSDFYNSTWKNSLYPKYISVPLLCYCPSDPEMQPGSWVGAPPWDPWDYLSYDYCIIGYIYTPNQQTVKEDLQGNIFPTNAEEADSAQALMADSNAYLGGDGWAGVHYGWNHFWGDSEGGNHMGGDAHVEWKTLARQEARTHVDTAWGEHEIWW